MKELRKQFEADAAAVKNPQVVVTATRLMSGAIEVQTNHKALDGKIQYILNTYDEEFKMVKNPEIQIVGYMIV